jgi:hypothetical protein
MAEGGLWLQHPQCCVSSTQPLKTKAHANIPYPADDDPFWGDGMVPITKKQRVNITTTLLYLQQLLYNY